MNESSFGGEWLFAFLVIAVLFGGGNFGFGGGNANVAAYATMADVNAAIAAQTSGQNQQAILLSSANNNYETSRLISEQNMTMMNQNNSNIINAIQGFNSTNATIASGFAAVNANIADLGYKMENCCCSIKTMLLEQKLADTQQALADSRNVAVNQAQSEFLLNTMGKWVANAPATA